ncbi:alpha/beta hydrolase family protein [Tabrizicola sp.]|uniref:alpha/beta hydrolase family protein n=1 Tax=Tabrizicola sp. TaxID=2005166 RepID=UPI003F2A5650
MRRVGYLTGLDEDPDRSDWDGAQPRPLAWSAWYPASSSTGDGKHPVGQFFDLGPVQVDADLAESGPFPVVLMSHGTGGSPESMGWLARKLAQDGYVVVGAHHHGNTGREPYRPEGFLCWWERALDLSVLLSQLGSKGPLAHRLDLGRVSAVGFSLGGYTVLAMAGARSSVERYVKWSSERNLFTAGPRELPDAGNHVPHLLKSSKVFRDSWARQGDSFVDQRIRRIVAIAPPPPVRAFDVASLGSISIPVTLITGEADTEAPSHECADWLVHANPRFRRVSVGEDVGHYTFLGFPAEGVSGEGFIFADNPGISRSKIHDWTADIVLTALGSS